MEKNKQEVQSKISFMEIENWGALVSANHSNRHYKLFKGELFPEKLFGQVDAVAEWEEDKYLSSKLFVHTESYDVFKRKSNLFVFGRRGTGKTALIKMLDYEIKNGDIKSTYSYSKIIYQEKTLFKLTLQLRNFKDIHTYHELSHVVTEILRWVIYTTAMMAVVEKNETHKTAKVKNEANKALSSKLLKIKKYLASQNLIQTEGNYLVRTPLEEAIGVLSQTIETVRENNNMLTSAITKTLNHLESQSYKDALNSLIGFLIESKECCVVLIDSQDIYDLDDSISEGAISGLIDAVLDVFNYYPNYRVLAKVAFPSEIVPHLRPSNLGKMTDKEHYIFWKYDDLLRLISKRYCQLLKEEKLISQECDETMGVNPKKFVYEYIPEKTESYSKIDFDSIAYIINHTQKKPRELILLFNSILTLAKKNHIPFTQITMDCIREGTNARIESLSSPVFDIYKRIFKGADQVIKKTFNNSENIMTYGEMHKKLREALSLLDGTKMDKSELERLFTESGVIGVIEDIRNVKENKYICEGNFEYQIKGTLTLQSQNKLVIHPMFYQELNIKVYSDLLVCPRPSKSEQHEIDLLSTTE